MIAAAAAVAVVGATQRQVAEQEVPVALVVVAVVVGAIQPQAVAAKVAAALEVPAGVLAAVATALEAVAAEPVVGLPSTSWSSSWLWSTAAVAATDGAKRVAWRAPGTHDAPVTRRQNWRTEPGPVSG